jgi:DNA-binding transcriptional LysR family regulator
MPVIQAVDYLHGRKRILPSVHVFVGGHARAAREKIAALGSWTALNIASFDLNLLTVFDALMSERSVTRAGQKIGLSQPAMSAALKRLRAVLDDPLFVRSHDGMRPSPRAVEISGTFREALRAIQGVLDCEVFDPSKAHRTFRIAMNDLGSVMLLERLSTMLGQWSDELNFVAVHADGAQAMSLLESGGVDVAIGPRWRSDQGPRSAVLFDAPFGCAMRTGHPLMGARLTPEAFADTPQIVVAQPGDPGPEIDRFLLDMGLRRRIAFTVQHYLPVPFLLANTDLIAVIPAKLVQRFGTAERIELVEAPFATFTTPTVLMWTEASEKDGGNTWLRSVICGIAREHQLERWVDERSLSKQAELVTGG